MANENHAVTDSGTFSEASTTFDRTIVLSEEGTLVEGTGGPNDELWGKSAADEFHVGEYASVYTGSNRYEHPLVVRVLSSRRTTAKVLDPTESVTSYLDEAPPPWGPFPLS